MGKNALVFSGRNGLDFIELRAGVLRIPEVSLRIREAQSILDGMPDLPKIDLFSALSSEDEVFFRNIQLKSLVAAIVQIGLYDRYIKTQKRADFMVGNSNGDSAMMVCAGRQSFRSLVESSQALGTIRTNQVVIPLVAQAMPLLSGLTLTEYHAFETKPNEATGTFEYRPVQDSSMELKRLVSSLHQEHSVTRFISIGPAGALRGSDYRQIGDGEIESLDSIELDPMLGWFWRNVRPQAIALAQ